MSATKHPFLDALAPKHQKAIERISHVAQFKEGELLFHQGAPDDRIFLIHDGKVALQVFAPGRGGVTIDSAGPGDYVGWSWVVPPFRAHYDALATEPVIATGVDANALRDLCEQDHELGYRVLSSMVKLMEHRLQGTRLLLLDLYGTSQ